MFWQNAVLIGLLSANLSVAFLARYLGYTQAYDGFMVIFVSIVALYPCVSHLRDHFSVVSISREGISAKFLGTEWFRAEWSELMYNGEFLLKRGRLLCVMLYLSRVPVTLSKKIMIFGTPGSVRLNYQAIFLEANEDTIKEITKYLNDECITKHDDCYYEAKKLRKLK